MNEIIYKVKCWYNQIFNRNTICINGKKIKLTQISHLSQDQLRECIKQYETALIECPESINAPNINLSDGVCTYNDMGAIRGYSLTQVQRNVDELVHL